MFDKRYFTAFDEEIPEISEAGINLLVHSLLVPSTRVLFAYGQTFLRNLSEGYDDAWLKAIPIHGPCPQPDHAVGFSHKVFTAEQHGKLGVTSGSQSYYTAHEGAFFPFLTCEVKCSKGGIHYAHLQNAHSMTIAVRAVVDLC